jgi:hypothetical protein
MLQGVIELFTGARRRWREPSSPVADVATETNVFPASTAVKPAAELATGVTLTIAADAGMK